MIRQAATFANPSAKAPQVGRALLLVVLAGPETETDPIAVAGVSSVAPLVGHATLFVGRVVGVPAADLAAIRLPDAVDDESRAGKNRGSVRQMHGAERLAG